MNRLRLVLAVVLPVAVLAVGSTAIATWRAPVELRTHPTDGGPDAWAPERIEARLAQTEPRVLVIGNSVARTDLDTDTLARALGLHARDVQLVSIPGSIGSDWYAVLRNRVYANGHAPALVLVLSPLRGVLETIPGTPTMADDLAVQLAGDEPESARRKMGGWRVGSVWLDRIRGNAKRLRSHGLRALRDAVGGDALDLAIQRVFAPAALDFSRGDGALPVIDVRGDGVVPATALPAPADSLVPEIQDLVCGHGGKLVFVRPPLSPTLDPSYADDVGARTEARFADLLDPRCATLVDLTTLAVGPGDFRDPVHLDESGAQRMTAVLAARLATLRAATDSAGLWIAPPAPPARVDGPARLAPGQSARIVVEGPWDGPAAAFQAQVVLWAPEASAPRVTFAGEPAVGDVREPGGRLRSTWAGAQPAPPWVIEVTAGEAPVELLAVGLGKGGARTVVVGTEAAFDRPAVDLLADDDVAARIEGLGDQVPGARRISGGRFPPAWQVPSLRRVFDALSREGPVALGACSPVEVHDRGRALPVAETCRELFAGAAPSCFDGASLWFRQRGDPVPPLVPRADARCAGGRWLAPGARLLLDVPAAARAELADVVRRVEVRALASDPDAVLRVAVRHGLERAETDRALAAERWVFNLEQPVAQDLDLQVTLENRSDAAWVLVRELLLR